MRDLYAEAFDPKLGVGELEHYEDCARNTQGIETEVAVLGWCDTLIFVYPTWWYGLPAVLKGWLDRVLVPGVAFRMPDENGDIKPALTHITRLAVFTTCGASRWLTCVLIDPQKFGATSEAVRLAHARENIESRPVWKPMHMQPVFDHCRIRGGAVSEELFANGLCLPSGSNLTAEDRERVVEVIRRVAKPVRPANGVVDPSADVTTAE